MIPKIIHYCWFGRNTKPELIHKCIESWKEFCPEWRIIEWNEDNFNIDVIPYMREAYDTQMWAFVSDVARLIILYKYGGLYLDTDVELLKPINNTLLEHTFFVFENSRSINTGLAIGAEKQNVIIKSLLNNYRRNHFNKDHFKVNSHMDRQVILKLFPELRWDDSDQLINNVYFMSSETYGKYMRHYGTRSWADLPEYHLTGNMTIKRLMRNPSIFRKLERCYIGKLVLPIYTFFAYDLLDLGIFYYIRLMIKKFKKRTKRKKIK